MPRGVRNKKSPPKECVDETKYCRWCAEEGVLQVKLYKTGWPDREVLIGFQQAFFIEFKRKGQKPSAIQLWVHKLLREHGYNVYVCYSCEEAIEATRREIQAQAASQKRHNVSHKKQSVLPSSGARSGKDDDGDPSVLSA